MSKSKYNPREMRDGNFIRITPQAERDWQKMLEEPSPAKELARKVAQAKGRVGAAASVQSDRHISKTKKKAAAT
jgi:hypothetical protein